MSRGVAGVCSWVLAAMVFGVACSQAALPPGTPPPEYETRPVEPWPPASAITAAPPAETAPQDPVLTQPVGDVLNDAGTPDLPDAAAPETGPF